MPSVLLGNPLASGAQQLWSGNLWSGRPSPAGGVQLRWVSSGGNAYIGLSGSLNITSGGMFVSGTSGLLDGFLLAPGDSYFVPKMAIKPSGTMNIFAMCDASASGIGRLYYEVYNWPLWIGIGLAEILTRFSSFFA